MSAMRTTATVAALLIATLVAVGCGGDQDSSNTTSDPDKPVKVRTVTPPEADEDLTDELGSAGEDLVDAGCVFGTYKPYGFA